MSFSVQIPIGSQLKTKTRLLPESAAWAGPLHIARGRGKQSWIGNSKGQLAIFSGLTVVSTTCAVTLIQRFCAFGPAELPAPCLPSGCAGPADTMSLL